MKRLREAVYRLYSQQFCRATLVEGMPAHGGPAMRCLFVGSTEFNHFFEDRIYASPPAVLRRSRLWIPRVPSLLATSPPFCDLCVADVPPRHARRFDGRADYRTGPMVFQHIDLSSDWAAQRSHPRRAAKLARKQGFTWSISREPADCLWFYERMYRPHALAQFGALANLSSYHDLESRLAQGYLLFVMAGDQRVAGSLELAAGETVTGYKIGVLDGDRRYVSQGAVAAVYHFTLEHARRQGCRRYDLVSSRPLLDDGAYVYKRHWGATVRRDDRPRSLVHLCFLNRSPEFASSFLQKNPMIVHSPEGLRGLVGVPAAERLDAAAEAALRARYYSPGLAGLTLVGESLDQPKQVTF